MDGGYSHRHGHPLGRQRTSFAANGTGSRDDSCGLDKFRRLRKFARPTTVQYNTHRTPTKLDAHASTSFTTYKGFDCQFVIWRERQAREPGGFQLSYVRSVTMPVSYPAFLSH